MRRTQLVWLLLFVFTTIFLIAGCSGSSDDSATDDDRALDDDDTPPIPDDDDTAGDDDTSGDDDDTVPPGEHIVIHSPTEGQTIVGPQIYVEVEFKGTPVSPNIALDGTSIISNLVYNDGTWLGTVKNVAEGSHTLLASATYAGDYEEQTVTFSTTMNGSDGWIDVDLSADYIAVGGSVTVSYTVYDGDGNDVTGETSVALTADPTAGVTVDGNDISFTIEGTYEIIATATVDSAAVTGSAYLVVGEAVDVDHVEITCTPDEVVAGESATCQGTAYDSDDNQVNNVPIVYTVSPTQGSTVNGNQITLTYATAVTITGTAAGTSVADTASVTVIAGPPDDIDLQLTPTELSVEETATAVVTVVDEYSNPIQATQYVTITTNPSEGVDVEGLYITPHIAEQIVVTATVNYQGSVRQDQGTLSVTDGVRPIIDITSPVRGQFITATNNITVTGYATDEHGHVETFTINGVSVPLANDGRFTKNITLSVGLNTLIFTATDNSGNTADATLSVLYAPTYLPNGSGIDHAVGAKINQSGLNSLSSVAEQLIEDELAVQLDELLPYEMFNETYELWGLELFHGEATLQTVTYTSPIQITLTSRPGGIDFEAYATNLQATGYLIYTFFDEKGQPQQKTTENFTITVDWVDITGGLDIWAEDGQLHATLGSVNTDWSDINIGINGSIFGDVIGWLLELFVNAFGSDIIQSVIEDTIMTELPPYIEEMLASLDLSFDFEFADFAYHLAADFSNVSFADEGGLVWLHALTWYGDGSWTNPGANTPDLPGSLLTNNGDPTMGVYVPGTTTPYEFGVALGDDILNQMLHMVHRSGLLSLDLDEETLEQFGISGFDLTTGTLGLFFPGLIQQYGANAEVILKLRPLLPPVFIINPTKGLSAEIQMGDFGIEFSTDDESWAKVAMALYIPVDVSVNTTGDEQTISLSFGDIEMYVDLYELQDGLRALDALFETFLPQLVEVLVPTLLGSVLEEFPIPSFEGYTLHVNDFKKIGPGSDWIGLFGSLVEAEGAKAKVAERLKAARLNVFVNGEPIGTVQH